MTVLVRWQLLRMVPIIQDALKLLAKHEVPDAYVPVEEFPLVICLANYFKTEISLYTRIVMTYYLPSRTLRMA